MRRVVNRFTVICLIMAVSASVGCASKFRTTMLGVGVGAASGMAASAIHDATMNETRFRNGEEVSVSPNYGRNLLISGLIGAAVGGTLFFVHHHLTEKKEQKIIKATSDAFLLHQNDNHELKAAMTKDGSTPWEYLNDPRRIEWVEPYIDGDEALHERHRRFFIYRREKQTNSKKTGNK